MHILENPNVEVTISKQHKHCDFKSYLQSLVQKHVSKAFKTICHQYQTLFNKRCKSMTFVDELDKVMDGSDDALERLSTMICSEVAGFKEKFMDTLGRQRQKMTTYLSTLAANLAKENKNKSQNIQTLVKKRELDQSIHTFCLRMCCGCCCEGGFFFLTAHRNCGVGATDTASQIQDWQRHSHHAPEC